MITLDVQDLPCTVCGEALDGHCQPKTLKQGQRSTLRPGCHTQACHSLAEDSLQQVSLRLSGISPACCTQHISAASSAGGHHCQALQKSVSPCASPTAAACLWLCACPRSCPEEPSAGRAQPCSPVALVGPGQLALGGG